MIRIKRFYILIFLGLVLPIGLFIVFEMISLDENQKLLEKIYNEQLETIVFSVNQYSDDILNRWADKMTLLLDPEIKKYDSIKTVLFNKQQITGIFFFREYKLWKYESFLNPDKKKIEFVSHLVVSNQKQLEKNKEYLKNNYRKNEPLGFDTDSKSLYMGVWSIDSKGLPVLGIMEIDARKFIAQEVAQRVRFSLDDKFIVAIIDQKSKDSMVYISSGSLTSQKFSFRKNLWLFPHFDLAIQIKGKSTEELVKERTVSNLLIFSSVLVLFITGSILIVLYTRKEMRLAQLKSEFISNVSHEIRTPLALISLYIESLSMGRIKDQLKINEYYNVILQEVQRLSGIVNNILNFSKLESGKRQINMELYHINSLVNDVMDVYTFHLNNKGFDYLLELPENIPQTNMDKVSMNDALVNLIDNAMKYSGDQKEITIRTGVANHFVFVEVIDKGIGISKEDQKLVFDQFFRVTKGNLAHQAKGTGLGLSIVKHIVNAHQGKIELESSPGEGSSFRILLPI